MTPTRLNDTRWQCEALPHTAASAPDHAAAFNAQLLIVTWSIVSIKECVRSLAVREVKVSECLDVYT